MGFTCWVPQVGEWRVRGKPAKLVWHEGSDEMFGHIYVKLGEHYSFRSQMPSKYAVSFSNRDTATYVKHSEQKKVHKAVWDVQTVTLKELEAWHARLVEITERNRAAKIPANIETVFNTVAVGDQVIGLANGKVVEGQVRRLKKNGVLHLYTEHGFVDIERRTVVNVDKPEKKEN